MAHGILSFGAYVPRLRLERRLIAEANGWFAPAQRGLAKGERAMANWDEDSVTMAVEAGRDALAGRAPGDIGRLTLATTTAPFADRLNSAIVAEALGLGEATRTADATGSQRCATGALIDALTMPATTLLVAAEKRPFLAAAPQEMQIGDGAAALLVGDGEPIAVLRGKASTTADFVDHFRAPDAAADYQWEERWIRDAGYRRIVPPAVAACLEQAGKAAGDVAHLVVPASLPRLGPALAQAIGVPEAALVDPLVAQCGDTGAAHPLLLLVSALETAKPGALILVVGFGQGADAVLLEVMSASPGPRPARGVSGHLARRHGETSYARLLAFNDLVAMDRGMRAEVDKSTPLSALWRNRAAVTAFVGGRCEKCGTRQFPRSRVCVNPNCCTIDTQVPEPFADKIGRINSFTVDRLTYSPSPPACYGMVQFEDGGRLMMDFTDIEASEIVVGRPMRMMFRIKDIDKQRGFRRYFWKAAPAKPASQAEGR